MALRLLLDENSSRLLFAAIRRHCPELDVVRAAEVGLLGSSDNDILEWAAQNHRVLLSHDQATLEPLAWARVGNDLPMPGVLIASQQMSGRAILDELIMLSVISKPGDFVNNVIWLPI
jgi:hypothetical protein